MIRSRLNRWDIHSDTVNPKLLELQVAKRSWASCMASRSGRAMIPESSISVGLLFIFELTRMREFSINNRRGYLVKRVGPHSQ